MGINCLQVGDRVEVQRDLGYFTSGRPWKGSVGVIECIDDYYADYGNITYLVNFGGIAANIPAHEDNIKETSIRICDGDERFVVDTNTCLGEQLGLTIFKGVSGEYLLNLESMNSFNDDCITLCSVSPKVIIDLAKRLEVHNMFNNKIAIPSKEGVV